MAFACGSTHNLFCVPNRMCRKLTSERGGLHSKRSQKERREEKKSPPMTESREENEGQEKVTKYPVA